MTNPNQLRKKKHAYIHKSEVKYIGRGSFKFINSFLVWELRSITIHIAFFHLINIFSLSRFFLFPDIFFLLNQVFYSLWT